MTAPGFVPRPDRTIVDRLAKIEARLRSMQQNTAGATTADGGAPLSNLPATIIGPSALAGAGTSCSRTDHVHTSTLAAQQDVSVAAPAAGNVLAYTGSVWANTARTLATDTDVAISAPAAGQALTYTGAHWANTTPTTNGQVILGSGIAGTLGTLAYTTSSTTELNIPKLALLNVPIVTGHAYVFHLYLYGTPSLGSADYFLRVRITTALTGTNILRWNMFNGTAGLDQMLGYLAPWLGTTTGNVNFYFSVQLLSGSGTMNIGAGSALWVSDGGPAAQWSYT